MKKWIKTIIALLGILILLAVITAVLLVLFVDPNRFKPLIMERVQKITGRQLALDGGLSWSFYPSVGVKLGHIVFHNPAGFSQPIFAEAKNVHISVRLLPLFHADIEANNILLDGLTLNLIKNANGQTNWQDLTALNKSTIKPADASPSQTVRSQPRDIFISAIDISNAEVNWIDESTKSRFTLDQFDFHAKDITFASSFPIKTQFHFSSNQPAVTGQVSLSTTVLLDNKQQFYQFKNVDLSAQIKQVAKEYKINTTADVTIDVSAQQMEVRHWLGDFATIKWTGALDVKNLKTQPYLNGSLKLQPFALQDVLSAIGQNAEDMPRANNVKADFTFNFDTGKKLPGLQKLSMHGLIKADDLQINKIKLTDLIAKTQMDNGKLTLPSLSAILYQGNLQGDVAIDLTNNLLPTSLNAKLTNVQAEQLMTSLLGASALKVKGAGNIELHANTTVKEIHAMFGNLNGTGNFSFNNGILEGVDIAYWANSAYALAKNQPRPVNDTHATPFGNLTGTIAIHNGVVANEDLVMDTPLFLINGKGTIDLVNQLINYSLKTKAKSEEQRKNLTNFYGLSIPILVTGNFKQPKISLDTADLGKQIAAQQVEKIKGQALEKIQQQLPNIGGAGGALLKNFMGQ